MIDPLSDLITFETPPSRGTSLPRRRILQRIGDSDDYILELDNTARDTFIVCPRSAENYLLRGRETGHMRSAISFGSCFHKCEEIRLVEGWEKGYPLQLEHAKKHFAENPPFSVQDHRTLERMLDTLDKYKQAYEFDGWTPQLLRDSEGVPFVERPFKIELCSFKVNAKINYPPSLLVKGMENDPPDFFFIRTIYVYATGKIDAMLEQAPYLFNVDTKTSREGGQAFEVAFHNSAQTVGYVWAAQRILQRTVHGLILNAVIVRPPVEKKSTLSRTEFRRPTFFYSQDMIQEWELNATGICADFVNCLVRGYFPQVPRSFKSPCPYCQYKDNCNLPTYQRGADLATDQYVDVTWNPLENE